LEDSAASGSGAAKATASAAAFSRRGISGIPVWLRPDIRALERTATREMIGNFCWGMDVLLETLGNFVGSVM